MWHACPVRSAAPKLSSQGCLASPRPLAASLSARSHVAVDCSKSLSLGLLSSLPEPQKQERAGQKVRRAGNEGGRGSRERKEGGWRAEDASDRIGKASLVSVQRQARRVAGLCLLVSGLCPTVLAMQQSGAASTLDSSRRGTRQKILLGAEARTCPSAGSKPLSPGRQGAKAPWRGARPLSQAAHAAGARHHLARTLQ